MPPVRKIQMTDLAFGATGEREASASRSLCAARTTPSRASIAPSANPVQPMPTSARKLRRLLLTQRHGDTEARRRELKYVLISQFLPLCVLAPLRPCVH